jgi:hypothetical protein
LERRTQRVQPSSLRVQPSSLRVQRTLPEQLSRRREPSLLPVGAWSLPVQR